MATPEVKFKYGADISAHERAMKRLKATSANAADKIKTSFKLAGAVATGAFVLMAKHALDMGDKMHKLNIRLGVSTEALSQLKHAADLSGISFNTMTMGIQRSTRRIAEAASGTGEARNALAELGLSAEKLNAIAPDRQLEVLADALQGVSKESDKVRIAMKLFDSEGVAMLQMLEGGSAGLREMRGEADALGMTLTQEGANNIAAFNDSMSRLKGQITGAVTVVVAKLGPTLTEMAEWFGKKLPSVIEFSVNAFYKIQEVGASVVASVTSGLIKFYDVLGKIPKVGGPYRDAAEALREFNVDLQTYTRWVADARTETEGFNVVFGEALGGEGGGPGGKKPSGLGGALDVEDFSNTQEQINSVFGDAMERRRQMRAEERAEEWNYRQQSLTEFYAFQEAEAEAAERLKERKIAAVSSTLNYTIMAGKLLLQSSQKDNKAIFAVVKAASIGQALISTYTGAANAMKDVPYPYNFAAAASVIAYGMAQVASITSQGMGGGGGAASAGVPVTSSTTAPTVDTQVSGVGTESGGAIHFHLDGNFVGGIPDEIVDDMIDKINDAGSERDVYVNVKEAQYAGSVG